MYIFTQPVASKARDFKQRHDDGPLPTIPSRFNFTNKILRHLYISGETVVFNARNQGIFRMIACFQCMNFTRSFSSVFMFC